MDININNLRKSDDTGDEFKITCNYNLLDNNQFVRWNGDDITLVKPYGLSKVNRIDFRNFKGELLPYTTIDLPDLWFEVLMTSKDIDTAEITSDTQTIYGNTLKYDESTDTRSVYKFKKAWTYDSSKDSQLEYNIGEGIDIINNRFNTLYPVKDTIQLYGLSSDALNTITYDYRPIDCNAGSMLMVADLDDVGNIRMINPLRDNSAHMERFNLNNTNSKYCAQCSVNYSNTIGYIWREMARGSEGINGAISWLINNGTVDSPNWELNYTPANVWEDWTTTNNKFGIDPFEPSVSLGHCPAGWCVVVSPLIGRNGERALAVIKTSSNAYWMDFRGVAYNNIVYVAAVYEDPANNANLYILAHYTVEEYPENIITGIFKVPFSSMSTSSDSPVNMSLYRVYSSHPLRSLMFNVGWTWRDKLCSCGKECYGVQVHWGADGNVDGIVFNGVRGCAITGDTITSSRELYGWQVDNYNMFVFDFGYKMKKVPITANVMNRINNGYANEESQEYLPFSGPVYVCRGAGGWIQNPEARQLRFIGDINNSFNPEGLKNAIHASNGVGVDLKASATQGEDSFQLANTAGDFATTDTDKWFVYENSQITLPQLVFPDNRIINFAVRIWTEPYYFEITTPCRYFGSDVFSIVKPALMPSYTWLNSHIINTLETLILLRFEFNNLKITCQMFPNMDGVVFFINEDAFIGFKSMNVSNTIDGLKVSIIGDDEKVSLDTLRRLYGKLSLSVDWVQ